MMMKHVVLINVFLQIFYLPASGQQVVKALDCSTLNNHCSKSHYIGVLHNSVPKLLHETKQLNTLVHLIGSHKYPSCINLLKEFLCHLLYPRCDKFQDGRLVMRRICLTSCVKIKASFCFKELEKIASPDLTHIDCSSLLDGNNCTSIDISTREKLVEDSCLYYYKQDEPANRRATTINVTMTTFVLHNKTCKELFLDGVSKFYHPNQLKVLHFAKMQDDNLLCFHSSKSLNTVIKNIDRKYERLSLRHLIIPNFSSRPINRHCLDMTYDMKLRHFKAYLGRLQFYKPYKTLETLTDVRISVIKSNNRLLEIAEGVVFLCYINFQYVFFPENKDVDIFHASSEDTMRVLYMELSNPIEVWMGSIAKYILNEHFNVFGSMSIEKPIWSIVFHENTKTVGFKGFSYATADKLLVFVEFIRVQYNSWMFQMTFEKITFLQLKEILINSFNQLLNDDSSEKIFTNVLPFTADEWKNVITIDKVQFTFSTPGIKLPASTYGQEMYDLYRKYMQGAINSGTTVHMLGRIHLQHNASSILTVLPNGTKFTAQLHNDGINFVTHVQFRFYDVGENIQCQPKTRKSWQKFIETFNDIQRNTTGTISFDEQSLNCPLCCQNNGEVYLHSMEIEFNFDDFDIYGGISANLVIKRIEGKTLYTQKMPKYTILKGFGDLN